MMDELPTDPHASRPADLRLADIEHKLDHLIAVCEALADKLIAVSAALDRVPCREGNGGLQCAALE